MVPRKFAKLVQQLGLIFQFRPEAAPELDPALRIVTEPFAQLGAGS